MSNLFLNPDVYDNRIAFICCDDLWEYNLSTKEKRKLVSGLGVINNARYYDNGTKIVFRVMTGESLNTADLYTIDLLTGSIKRLTYFSGKSVGRRMFTDVAGFSKDGSLIISTDTFAPFGSMTFLYRVVDGGKNFEPLNLGPATHIIYRDAKIFLGRNTFDLPHWKEYHGGTRGKLWTGNIDTGFSKIIDLNNHISSPILFRDRIYFVSDLEGSGQIFSTDLEGKDLKKHTDFDDYYPRHMNTDGKNIVFSKGGKIYFFYPENDTVKEIEIGSVYETGDALFSTPSKYLEDYHIANDDVFLFVSRGQCFLSDVYLNYKLKIPETLRIRKARFAGKNILYVFGTIDGDVLKLYDKDTDRTESIPYDFGNIFSLKTSIDGRYAVIGNDRFEILLVDLKDKTVKIIDKSQEEMILDFVISQDSRFVAYSFPVKATFLGSYSQRIIRLYDSETGKAYDMTSRNSNDYSPAFDPKTRYLFYLSTRSLDPDADKLIFNFSYSSISKPFAIPLRLNDTNPARTVAEKFIGEPGEYDLENAILRSSFIDVERADYRSIIPTDKGVYLFKVPPHGEFSAYYSGTPEKGILQKYDFKEKKPKDIKKDVVDFRFSDDLKKMLFRKDDLKICLIDLEKPDEEINIDIDRLKLRSSKTDEFGQMYDEAWKLARDNYWDEKKAVEISSAIYDRYKKLLPYCQTRFDLSFVITEMQGEFRTSHSYEMIGHATDVEASKIGKLAVDFSYNDGEYSVKKIYYGDPSNENEKSPFLTSNIPVEEGDVIQEIDGIEIGQKTSVFEALNNKSGVSLKLKLERKNSGTISLYSNVLDDDRYIRYRSWVEKNRKYVHEKSNGKIGYVHIPDMGMMGLNEFYRLYVTELAYEGMIVDVRYNGGGFVSQLILEKLQNTRLGYDKPRRGTLHPYPSNSVNGPMIAITNEYAGSDGDIFSYSFKALKLGKLIGVRTWGGVVGISPRRKLIDGSVLTQPEYSFWFKETGYGVENYGVDPDVEVQYNPVDYYNNVDPQLDYALTSIKKDIPSVNDPFVPE